MRFDFFIDTQQLAGERMVEEYITTNKNLFSTKFEFDTNENLTVTGEK